MADEIVKNTYGFKLIFDYGTSLSAATVNQIIYIKPRSTTTGTWTATVNGETIEYTVLDGDFDVEGDWSYQGRVVTSTWEQSSKVKNIKVTDLLE